MNLTEIATILVHLFKAFDIDKRMRSSANFSLSFLLGIAGAKPAEIIFGARDYIGTLDSRRRYII